MQSISRLEKKTSLTPITSKEKHSRFKSVRASEINPETLAKKTESASSTRTERHKRHYRDRSPLVSAKRHKHHRDSSSSMGVERQSYQKSGTTRPDSEGYRHQKAKQRGRYESSRHHRESASFSGARRRKLAFSHHHDTAFLDELTKLIPKRMNDFGLKYNGSAHLTWSYNLCETYSKLPPRNVEQYAKYLYKHIDLIKCWSIESLTVFYTNMVKVGFFTQQHALEPVCGEKIVDLHNELIKRITTKLAQKHLVKNTLMAYVHLISAISNTISIQASKESKKLVAILLSKIADEFILYENLLPSEVYKNLMSCMINIYQVDDYKESQKKLIEKHLCEVSKIPYSEYGNKNLSKFLLFFTGILKESFPVTDSVSKDLLNLIKKIDFSSNPKNASVGLTVIVKSMKEEHFNYKDTKSEIEQCINCLEKNTEKFDLKLSFSIARSISDLAIISKDISNAHLKVLNACLSILSENWKVLTSKELVLILRIIGNKNIPDLPCSKIFERAVDVISNIYSKLMFMPLKHLRGFFYSLSLALKAVSYSDPAKVFLRKNRLLNPFFEKYSRSTVPISLNERLNDFGSLSTISMNGIPLEHITKKLLNDLFKSLDKETTKMSTKKIIDFINTINSLGLFINENIDIEKYYRLLMTTSDELFFYNDKEKLILLWNLLVFCSVNRKRLEKEELKNLEKAMYKLYMSINKEIDDEKRLTLIIMVENWLKLPRTKRVEMSTRSSDLQYKICDKLKTKFPDLHFKEEFSINNLPPCDIVIPSKKIAIEVQGPHHYVDKENKIRTGATELKIELLKREGYKVIEVQANDSEIVRKSLEECLSAIEKSTVSKKPRFK